MTVHGYEIIGDWENSNCGMTALASKDGKKYFLKQYKTVVAPIDNGALDAKTIAHNQKLFDDFVDRRRTVNTRIRSIAGTGGNIIIPTEEFINGNQLVEASEFVEGVVSKDDTPKILARLPLETKKLLMMTAAGALASVHAKGIIHCDLKLPNVLLVENSSGVYVAKLIDFDSSFPADNKPDEMVGTPDFYSPELGRYANSEDYSEENKKTVTEKTDIFSLGLIYHFYRPGKYPEAASLTEKLQKRKDKGKVIYPYVVLNNGCELVVSPDIKEAGYAALIKDMLNIDPEARPTALQVLMRLKAPSAPPADSSRGGSTASSVSARPTASASTASASTASAAAPTGFEEPLAEYNIVLNEDKIKSAGFVAGKNSTFFGTKGYTLYTASGTEKFMKAEMLTLLKYASKKTAGASRPTTPARATTSTPAKAASTVTAAPAATGFASPWSEHRIAFDETVIKSKGFVSSTQKTMNGVNGYEFVRSNGTCQFIRVEMILMMKMARKI